MLWNTMYSHEIDDRTMRLEIMWRLHDKSEGKMSIHRAITIFINLALSFEENFWKFYKIIVYCYFTLFYKYLPKKYKQIAK